jgi:hypothetical protein
VVAAGTAHVNSSGSGGVSLRMTERIAVNGYEPFDCLPVLRLRTGALRWRGMLRWH